MVAALTLAVLQFTVVNPAWWQTAGVDADGDGLTLRRYSAKDKSLAWSEIASVRVDEGWAFPHFTDDTTLVVVGTDGEELAIPTLRAAQ